MMTSKVAIIDTSLLCCWLEVPGCEEAGGAGDLWTKDRTESEIAKARTAGFDLVLPFAALIETGNHVAHGGRDRYSAAVRLSNLLREALSGTKPWVAFFEQLSVLGETSLPSLVASWPDSAARGVSIGDHLISAVADYYAAAGVEVMILSSDKLLRSYTPKKPASAPRRRG